MNILIIIAIIIIIIMLIMLITYKPTKTLLGGSSKKYVIVGDIHGNKEQFNLMMTYINKGYTAIFMGDLTQEHNDSKYNMTDFSEDVYNLLKQGKLIWVCGNHDLLQYYATKTITSGQEIHKNYPKIYTKAIEWAKTFPLKQKWFIKCFEDKLVKFKLLMDSQGNILSEEDTDVTLIDKYFKNELSLNDLRKTNLPNRNIKCFSHWVINKLTPIKTTKEFYEMLEYVDNDHFDKWFELYDNIWIREDYLDQRIYTEHYVGHSNILMLIGRETIDPLIPEDIKIKTETLTYLMFKCFWPNEIQTKFLNKIASHKNIEFYEEKLKNINAETIIDEINTAGFYSLGSLHLCDVYPDRYELSKHVKMPESLPKVFELEF